MIGFGEEHRLARMVPGLLVIRFSKAARQSGSSMFFQRLKPGFSCLDGGQDGFPFGGTKLFPGCAKLGLPGLVALGLSVCSAFCRASSVRCVGPVPRHGGLRSGLGLIISRYLVIGPDRGDQVARRVLANSLILVAQSASRRPRSWCGSGRGDGSRPVPGRSWP